MPEPDAAGSAAGRRLLNATAIMASGTLVSRILGFVKATLLVIVLGATSPLADAYSLATLVPNSLYMIFAGGALNTVLVPQIVRHTKNDADGGVAFINRVITAFGVALLGVTALATAFAPQVMSLWTSASWRTPDMAEHWTQLVLLATLTMPQLFFYGAFFMVGQVLNARDRFGPMMWAPIVNNVVGIAVLGLYVAVWGTNAGRGVPFTDAQVYLLGVGSTLGIVAQTIALVPSLRSIKFDYRPRWDLKGQGLGETFHLAKWMLGYVLLTTVVQAVVSRLASDATVAVSGSEGAGVAAYSTAYLVWILPHSLLTVSLATAMLPSASRLAAAHDLAGVAAETTRTMRLAATFLLPSSVAFLVLGLPFTRLAFGHGAGADGWVYIGWTLMAFAVGLVPYTVQYVYLRGFYALEDTRTPFLIQIAISGANVVFALALTAVDANPFTVAPRLALAYSLSYVLGAFLTHAALRRRLPGLPGVGLVQHLGQLLVAVLPGAAIAGGVTWWTLGSGSDASLPVVLGGFVASAAVAVIGFFFVAKRLGVAETTQLLSVLRRRAPGTTGPEDPTLESLDAATTAAEQPANASLPTSDVFDETPLLAYPDPADASRTPSTTIPQGDAPVGHVVAGQVLDGRYRLDEVLSRRGSTLTWRAWDLKLSRPVLLHVLHPGDRRALEILDQARRAAPAVDSRFLRVWDAALVEDQPHGSYIVCEYAPGESLELVLRRGVLSDTEAAWVVRELASGLAAMHAQGLHHRELTPDTVVVTATGNVKIIGFLVEHALRHPGSFFGDGEAADVRALGELLYACLLGRWPGAARYGLPSAPTDAQGRPLLPREVTTRVRPELSDLVDRILSAVPAGRASRLTSAADIAAALSVVVGGADASPALAIQLRGGGPGGFVGPADFAAPDVAGPDVAGPGVGAGLGADAAAARASGFGGPVTARVPAGDGAGDGVDDVPPSLRGRPDASPVLPGTRSSAGEPPEPFDDHDEDSTQAFWLAEAESDPYTPIPPPVPPPVPADEGGVPAEAESRRPWRGAAIGASAVVLVVALAVVLVNQFARPGVVTPTPAAAHVLVGARDFDPKSDGGDDRENPDQARLAIDGDLATAWTTERYGRSSNFNARKPGAGVVVDLGEARPIGTVIVNLGARASGGEIRVPADAAATTPPVASVTAWTKVGSFAPAAGEVRVQVSGGVQARFVLVYLTELPKDGLNYVGAIHEIAVTG